MSPSKILVCVSGSIAAYKSAELVSLLKKSGCEVKVVATDGALQFIGKATLEALSGHQLYTQMFATSQKIHHINLVKWADLIVLYPASASTLGRLRLGLAEDLLTACFVANNFIKPYLIAPSMNVNMYEHPAVQDNLKTLRSWGARVIEPASGTLACGTAGKGRAPEPAEILKIIKENL